jgi:hypothetical protein
MQGDAAGVRIRQRRLIERVLERTNQGVHLGLGRPADTRRRHQAATKLAHDFFPHLGMCGYVTDVQGVEREIRGLRPLVVAREAVSAQEGAIRCRGWCKRCDRCKRCSGCDRCIRGARLLRVEQGCAERGN